MSMALRASTHPARTAVTVRLGSWVLAVRSTSTNVLQTRVSTMARVSINVADLPASAWKVGTSLSTR